jgi:hypothetical protein
LAVAPGITTARGGDDDAPAAAPVAWTALAASRRELGAGSAAATTPIQNLIGIFIGDGTATHPNAGILVGNGYSWTAETCNQSQPCNGGRAGLLIGNGGNGFGGGNGGSAGFFGNGGNGGAAINGGPGGDGGRGGFVTGNGGAGGTGGDSNTGPGGAGGKGGNAGWLAVLGNGGAGGAGGVSMTVGGAGGAGGRAALWSGVGGSGGAGGASSGVIVISAPGVGGKGGKGGNGGLLGVQGYGGNGGAGGIASGTGGFGGSGGAGGNTGLLAFVGIAGAGGDGGWATGMEGAGGAGGLGGRAGLLAFTGDGGAGGAGGAGSLSGGQAGAGGVAAFIGTGGAGGTGSWNRPGGTGGRGGLFSGTGGAGGTGGPLGIGGTGGAAGLFGTGGTGGVGGTLAAGGTGGAGGVIFGNGGAGGAGGVMGPGGSGGDAGIRGAVGAAGKAGGPPTIPLTYDEAANQPKALITIFGLEISTLVDTGAPGLVIPYTLLEGVDLGPSTGITGMIPYGVDPTYQKDFFDVYLVPVVFENGIATSSIPVGVITEVQYLTDGVWEVIPPSLWPYYGVGPDLGVGVGATEPTVNIASPVYALPETLANGLLIDMSASGPLIRFGDNPLPPVANVPDWRGALLKYQIISPEGEVGSLTTASQTFIDSGGLGGSVSATALPADLTDSKTLPVETKINVYTPDGQWLYQTTVTREDTNGETVVLEGEVNADYLNTGTAPFLLGPLYFDYSTADGIARWAYSWPQ